MNAFMDAGGGAVGQAAGERAAAVATARCPSLPHRRTLFPSSLKWATSSSVPPTPRAALRAGWLQLPVLQQAGTLLLVRLLGLRVGLVAAAAAHALVAYQPIVQALAAPRGRYFCGVLASSVALLGLTALSWTWPAAAAWGARGRLAGHQNHEATCGAASFAPLARTAAEAEAMGLRTVVASLGSAAGRWLLNGGPMATAVAPEEEEEQTGRGRLSCENSGAGLEVDRFRAVAWNYAVAYAGCYFAVSFCLFLRLVFFLEAHSVSQKRLR